MNILQRIQCRLAEKTVYKVVRESKYRSAIVRGKAEVEYEVGRWAVAPEWLRERGYDLLCFECFEDARDFAFFESGNTFATLAVWEAGGKGIRKGKALPPKRWVERLMIGELRGNDSWPTGTVMARTVCLRKKLWDSNTRGKENV